jgi:hypothetical protein
MKRRNFKMIWNVMARRNNPYIQHVLHIWDYRLPFAMNMGYGMTWRLRSRRISLPGRVWCWYVEMDDPNRLAYSKAPTSHSEDARVARPRVFVSLSMSPGRFWQDWMTVKNELKGTGKKVAIPQFTLFSQCLRGSTEESDDKAQLGESRIQPGTPPNSIENRYHLSQFCRFLCS